MRKNMTQNRPVIEFTDWEWSWNTKHSKIKYNYFDKGELIYPDEIEINLSNVKCKKIKSEKDAWYYLIDHKQHILDSLDIDILQEDREYALKMKYPRYPSEIGVDMYGPKYMPCDCELIIEKYKKKKEKMKNRVNLFGEIIYESK